MSAQNAPDHHGFFPSVKTDPIDDAYYTALGGRGAIERVHVIFYDMLFAHPWLKGFFEGKDKAHLVAQQTDFMASILGGPPLYSGRLPGPAHCHIFITEEIFDLRHRLLGEALHKARIPDDLQAPWLRRDWAMRAALVKQAPDDCVGRFKQDPIVVVPKP